MYDYDMLVIGSGPSGRRAAVQFAKLGKSVLVVEKGRRVGGVSVHTGTIPSKTLRETVLNLSGWRERGFYGRSYRVKQDIAAQDLIVRLQKTLDHEVEVLEHQFSRNLVRTAAGEAPLCRPAPDRGDGGERRNPHCDGRAHPDRLRHAAVPSRLRAVRRQDRVRLRRDHRPAETAAQPRRDRRRRDRGRIRHHLLRARRRRDPDRTAADVSRFHRQGTDRGIHARAARPQCRAAARLRGELDRATARAAASRPSSPTAAS